MFLEGVYKKKHFSKVYVKSMLMDPLTVGKFGWVWMFKQPDLDDFARVILRLLGASEDLLREYQKEENVLNEEIGYRPDSRLTILQNNDDFKGFQ